MSGKKKTCFIITPIGDDGTDIRRHIDGIIEAAIFPALEKEFDIKAAHHISQPGNITKQIIKRIYESDLVIANLTGRNPNVMYELALRHCIGKPTIMISDKNTILPSDIISERTIFYINDSKGVLELKDKLYKCLMEIDFTNNQRNSPIYDALKEINIDNIFIDNITKENPKDGQVLSLILKRIDNLENKIKIKDINKEPVEKCITLIIKISLKQLTNEELDTITKELEEAIKHSFMHALIDEHSIFVTPTTISIILNFEKGTDVHDRTMSFMQNILYLFQEKKIDIINYSIKDFQGNNYY